MSDANILLVKDEAQLVSLIAEYLATSVFKLPVETRTGPHLKAEESIHLHDERAVLQRGRATEGGVAAFVVDDEQL